MSSQRALGRAITARGSAVLGDHRPACPTASSSDVPTSLGWVPGLLPREPLP